VNKVINPTPEEVEEVHVKFTEALIELFETHKERLLVNPNIKLHIDWIITVKVTLIIFLPQPFTAERVPELRAIFNKKNIL
jgi:hypothetical protein